MKSYLVNFETIKPYLSRGEGPIIVLEDEYSITLVVVVVNVELCYIFEKNDTQATLQFKLDYLSNPRVIYPINEIVKKQKVNIEVEETYDSSTYSRPGTVELERDVRSEEDDRDSFDESNDYESDPDFG